MKTVEGLAEVRQTMDGDTGIPVGTTPVELALQVGDELLNVQFPLEVRPHPRFGPLQVNVRQAKLMHDAPWTRSLGQLTLPVNTRGWRFPAPPDALQFLPKPEAERPTPEPEPTP